MANRYKKKGSATLITREMRFKTTVRYWVTTVTMVNIRKTKENNYWQECGEKGTLGYCWCACKLVQFCGKPGFPGSSAGKESACNVGNLGSVPGSGRSPWGGHGNTLQYSYLENHDGQRSLVGHSPWGESVRHDWAPILHWPTINISLLQTQKTPPKTTKNLFPLSSPVC